MAWPDDRLDRLEGRVDECATDVAELRGEVRSGFKTMRDRIEERFDIVDQAHANVERRAGRVDWKTVLAVASTVVVPIVVALIVSGGS